MDYLNICHILFSAKVKCFVFERFCEFTVGILLNYKENNVTNQKCNLHSVYRGLFAYQSD